MRSYLATSMFLLCVFLVLPLSSAIADISEYGTVPRVWMHVGGYETPDDDNLLTEEEDFTWMWGGPPVIGTAYGYADMSTPESAVIKARPTLYYHDPYGTGELSIASDVGTWKPFTTTSTTLNTGDPITVMLDVGYAGVWTVIEGSIGKSSDAYASFGVSIGDKDDVTLGSLSGSARITGDYLGNYTQDVDGEWTGQIIGAGGGLYSLDYSNTLVVDLELGETYYLYSEIATSANSSAGDGGGWDTSQTLADANFSNTATYLLHSNDDVAFVIVPEPAVLSLLVIGGLMLMIRKRKYVNSPSS